MSRLLSIILIVLGGYYLFQKRFRVLNMILGNSIIRRIFVSFFMNIPGVRDRIMGTVFPKNPYPI
jgi:hypothetical protein